MASLIAGDDPGQDGHTSGAHTNYGRDAFAMVLGYHERDFVKSGSVLDSTTAGTASRMERSSVPMIGTSHSRRPALFQRTKRYWPACYDGALMIVIMSALLFGNSGCYRSTTLKRYIVDESFRGMVVIAFGDKHGEPSVTDLGTLVYTIPKSGLLFTQGKLIYGPVKDSYYLRDSIGTLRRIRYIYPWTWGRPFRDSNEVVAWGGLTRKTKVMGKDVHFAHFHVGRVRDADSLSKLSESAVDAVLDSIDSRFRNQ